MQNIWDQKGYGLNRQKRRAQLVRKCLKKNKVRTVLDCGCSEGYATSYISQISEHVVGVELDMSTLRIAQEKNKFGAFINASIMNLPFRDNSFDAVCILEVLEHLTEKSQRECLEQINYVLSPKGMLLVSVPYKEKIIQTRCIHCSELTPLYGHLQSLDEDKIKSCLPKNFYLLVRKYHLPNLGFLSCSSLFEPLPFVMWLIINDYLGHFRKGYWILLQYVKS